MARRPTPTKRKVKASGSRPRRVSVVLPAVGVALPLGAGSEQEILFDWDAEVNAVTAVWDERNSSGEILLVPAARWLEALTLRGRVSDPTILASRCRLVNSQAVGGTVRARIRGIETVSLKWCRKEMPYAKFSFYQVENNTIPAGRNGDGVEETPAEIVASGDLLLESALRQLPLPQEGQVAVEREMGAMLKGDIERAQRSRSYLSLIAELPWGETPPAAISIEAAKQTLDRAHAGMTLVKERVLDFVAAQAWWSTREHEGHGRPRTSILLVGPPGVGKTTIAQSIADALGVPCEVVALGGMVQEASLIGLDRGYTGALPGGILNALHRAKTRRLVIVLDEIDKLGDPRINGILLSILDPSQNGKFRDRYLNIPIDLSTVVFVATANDGSNVHAALHDRMDVINLNGYSRQEKITMATSHLLPREMEVQRIREGEIVIPPAVINTLVNDYSVGEAGVRGLSMSMGRILKRAVRSMGDGTGLQITDRFVRTVLGPTMREDVDLENPMEIGTVWGLSVKDGCGDLLLCETALVPQGKGNLVLTGELEKVISESATMILTLARIKASQWGADPQRLRNHDIHINLPSEGAKEGPSAGCALFVALMSALMEKPVRQKLAMTGKLSLNGQALPIGGLRPKLLAAVETGIEVMLIPVGNLPDLAEIPPEEYASIDVVAVSSVDELMALAFPSEGQRQVDIVATGRTEPILSLVANS